MYRPKRDVFFDVWGWRVEAMPVKQRYSMRSFRGASRFSCRSVNQVFLPFDEGHPFDLVVLAGDRFVRIQCKTAWSSGGCVVFNSHATDHGQGIRSYVGRADLFGVYFPPVTSVFLVPVAEVPKHVGRLRVKPARNNQKRRVRLAEDFLIDRWTTEALTELVRQPARLSSRSLMTG